MSDPAAAIAQLDYPMLIVTAVHGRERAGCLVGFAAQVSIDPLHYLVGLSIQNRTYRIASGADGLAVHALAKRDLPLARVFGEQTGDDVDKFEQAARAGATWSTIDGLPVFDDVRAWFTGRILRQVPLGDHVGFLLEPREGHVGEPGDPLLLSDVAEFHPGHPA